MAMTIFLTLNGLGVIFLLYTLANFWRDGRRPKDIVRKHARNFRGRDSRDVTVFTRPIPGGAQDGLSAISSQEQYGKLPGAKDRPGPATREVIEIPLRNISTSNRRARMAEYDSFKAMKEGRQC
jgi:hypothetical protein